MIYTFYSYKGGAGRSMALANVAELFYQRGSKVLMVDWDLEAPGLERFFSNIPPSSIPANQAEAHAGILDMLLEYKHQMAQLSRQEKQKLANKWPFVKLESYLLKIYPRDKGNGELWLFPAGKRKGELFVDYANRVRTFDWKDFYENWEGELFFEWLRHQFLDLANIVLIDSRTGVSEIGGVCTYQFADVVMMFCTANQQSISGTYRMAKNLKRAEVLKRRNNRTLKILIIPARIEDRAETVVFNEIKEQFNTTFADFAFDSSRVQSKSLWELKIPYVPLYAFNEIVAVREREGEKGHEDIVEAFVSLVNLINEIEFKKNIESRFGPIFEDRQFELDNILNNINNPAGKHFWIVMAAPQMGKTWFLDQLSKRLWEPEKSQWVVKNVDLQEESHEEEVIDSNQIISNYFEIRPDQHPEWSIEAAKKVRESQRSWLLLLDSAELLEEREVAHLRQNLSQVYQHLFKSGNINYRLAFVVASHRYHQQWKGISPLPRFFVQELTPFKSNVVENALRGWIKQIEEKEHRKFPGFGDLWYRTNAEKLCQVTEGLPKLLRDYMMWMKDRGFIELEGIDDRATFELLVKPYVEQELFSPENLCPFTQKTEEADFLERIVLSLSAYRLFTISHLQKVISKDSSLEKFLKAVNWSIEKQLWAKLSRSYLIDQSLREPWIRVYPSIRRLLFRYQYASPEAQMEAHTQAEKFYQGWDIPGLSEQSVVVVERLWHQAEYLRLSCASDAKDQFITFTRNLLQSVGPPDGFRSRELLDHIEKRILNPEDPDSEEFQRTIEAIEAGLFKRFQKILTQVKGDESYASI